MSACRPWRRMLLAGIALLFPAALRAADPPPSPSPHYVFDEARWLDAAEFRSLDARLQAYERETSSQLVVAIFQRIPPGAEMVDFSQRVFEAWKPGQERQDNGVILFVFAEDRKLRIHTGYGMEGVLPDAVCMRIIREVITPRLREGKRGAGIKEGVEAIIAATKGEYMGTGRTNLDDRGLKIPLPLVFFLIIVVIAVIQARRGSHPDVIITHRGSRHDGWGGWGGWGSGGGWSSGSGGGGFSGGGGSSGGGGASGGW